MLLTGKVTNIIEIHTQTDKSTKSDTRENWTKINWTKIR